MPWTVFSRSLIAAAALSLAACSTSSVSPSAPLAPDAPTSTTSPAPQQPAPLRIGLALGGGAAKGFAHIGVIKVLEANGLTPDMVAGTSAGSIVGALYASGMSPQALQKNAVALDENTISDLQWSTGGLIKGQKLQDYVNSQVQHQPLEKLGKPFVAVATRLEDGQRIVFARGNTGQAVRASSSIPGVFEPVQIAKQHYVDGGVVSPVPVEATRELGADIVIAVDISDRPRGQKPNNLLDTMGQSITIMGHKLGQIELAQADVTIRPEVLDIGPSDFTQRAQAIAEGEKAALAAIPEIRAKIAELQFERQQAAQQAMEETQQARTPTCLQQRSSWQKIAGFAGWTSDCPSP